MHLSECAPKARLKRMRSNERKRDRDKESESEGKKPIERQR